MTNVPETNRFWGGISPEEAAKETEATAELKRREGTPPVPAPISADAEWIASAINIHVHSAAREASGRIVKHLWIIFVCLPIVLGILLLIVK